MTYQLVHDNEGKLYQKFEDGTLKKIVPIHELFMSQPEPTPKLDIGIVVLYSEYKDMKFCDGIYNDCIGKIINIDAFTYTLNLYGQFNINKFMPKNGTKKITFNSNSSYETISILSDKDLQNYLPYNNTQKEVLKEYVPATCNDLYAANQTKDSIKKKYCIILENGDVVNLPDIYVNELYKFIENASSIDNSWITYTDKYVNFLTQSRNYLPLVLNK